MNMLERIKKFFQRPEIESDKWPQKMVQEPTSKDDSVMLHTGTDQFYMDPRIEELW